MQTPWLARIIGLVIAMTSIGASVLLWVTVGTDAEVNTPLPIEEVFVAGHELLFERYRPPPEVFWAAVSIALLAASVVALVERWAARRARRTLDPGEAPLAPRLVMERTAGVFAGELTITVLIPAHDEEDALPVTIPSLLLQERPPDRVLVVADNCRDRTVEVARSLGVDVFETVGNIGKKAGALNQALAEILPGHGDNDVIMVMDADTAIDQGFLRAATDHFIRDRALMAVGGLFYGEEGHGLLGQFQRNEYTRYQRQINRRRGKVFVLTGTSSVFRPAAFRALADHRGRTIPGNPGDYYSDGVLTEDNEITLALKSLGALMVSPRDCTVVTELMPTWGDLWRQRMRWQRGAVENLGQYGLTPGTFRYWGQQIGIGYSVIAFYSFMLLMLVTVLAVDQWVWFPFWLLIGAVFVLEQVVTVWRGGWRARLLAALLFPELVYAMYIQAVYVRGIWDITWNRASSWGHVQRGSSSSMEGQAT